MLAFLGVALLVYGAMHLYALAKLWQAIPHVSGIALGLVLFGVVMTCSPLLLWQLARQNWHSVTVAASWLTYTWMGFLFLFCCNALIFDLGHMLAGIVGLKWPLNESVAVLSVGVFASAFLGYGLIEARQIRVERITIVTPKLAPDVGHVTIAQISDLHLGAMLGEGFLEGVIAKLHEIHPDVVVATGDIVDGQGNDLDQMARRFHGYEPAQGAYAIVGNHEYYVGLETSLRFLRNAGFTVLRGEAAEAGGLVFVGVDDASAATRGQAANVDTAKALAAVSKERFIVLLKHQPVVDNGTPFDLQLSGHIHGGQMFPFGYLTRLIYGVDTGLTQLEKGRKLYVSRGTGTWGPPIRLFAPPEITLITIESAPK